MEAKQPNGQQPAPQQQTQQQQQPGAAVAVNGAADPQQTQPQAAIAAPVQAAAPVGPTHPHHQPQHGHPAHPSQQPRTLYVGNLDGKVSEEFLVAMFQPMGPLKACKIHHGHDGGAPAFAFVEYTTHDAAAAALVAMNKRTCLNKELKVNWANTNNQNNGHGHRSSEGGGSREHRGGSSGHEPPLLHPFNNHHHASSNNQLIQAGGQQQPIHPGKVPPQFQQAAKDTSQHHHIFVGDLSPEIETETLRNAFTPYGEISDCRVVKDLQTQKSRGFGFVSFVQKADAQAAIEAMNGQWLGNRAIRTNWASRKPPAPFSNGGGLRGPLNGHGGETNGKDYGGGGLLSGSNRHPHHQPQLPLVFEEVFKQASPVNCTVYCGGLLNSDESVIRRTFSNYGRILEVRYFKDKGYAFVRFDQKESACNAIVALHGTEVAGCQIKCSWGKENPGGANGGGSTGGGGGAAAGYMSAHLQAAAQQQQQQTQHLSVQMQQALAMAQAQAQQAQQVQQQQQPLLIQAPQSMDPVQQQQFYQQQQQQYAYCLYNPAAAAAAAGFIPQMQYYGQPAMNMNPAAYAGQAAVAAAAAAAAAQQQQQFQQQQQQQPQQAPAPQQ